MAREPVAEGEARDRTLAGRGGVARAVGQHGRDGRGELVGPRRLVALVPVGMRHADAALVADQLDRPTARRVRDGESAGERLDHRRRAGVVDLRVEEDMRSVEHRRGRVLRVPPEELDGSGQAEALHRRLGIRDETTGDEEARAGVRVEHVAKRLEPKLEPVGLRLVAAEEDDRAVGGRLGRA